MQEPRMDITEARIRLALELLVRGIRVPGRRVDRAQEQIQSVLTSRLNVEREKRQLLARQRPDRAVQPRQSVSTEEARRLVVRTFEDVAELLSDCTSIKQARQVVQSALRQAMDSSEAD